jgi:hypothetical protein
MVVAGQSTPEAFMRWVNSYGNLGTWGGFRSDTPANLVSGLSAALGHNYWLGRLLLLALVLTVAILSARAVRRVGPFAWALLAWVVTYLLFFAWWQPEVLKFWVLALPAACLLILVSTPWESLSRVKRATSLAAGALVVLLLFATNAPEIWAKRDPMSDPARRVSDTLSRLTGPEDLIVLQASAAEHYLPFYYDRINLMSTRELWYSHAGLPGREAAIRDIRARAWHALAKGSSVWIEDRVLAAGEQSGDRYVFTQSEVERLLTLYRERTAPVAVEVGPSTFHRLSPGEVIDRRTDWAFALDSAGWSGVNLAGESFGEEGWCFAVGSDPNLYGPPLRIDASQYGRLVVNMRSESAGEAQLFFRHGYSEAYSEEKSLRFDVSAGAELYTLDLAALSGWNGTVTGLRLDPVEEGDGSKVCISRIELLP